MKQYHQLLNDIIYNGTVKPAARENMPGTKSLFGYQFRHDLSEGFPLITTKRVNFRHIVVELLWFLRGDTNIKYLLDNGVNIWNEDAYNYYLKVCYRKKLDEQYIYDFYEFIEKIKTGDWQVNSMRPYYLGDCGNQYGQTWRSYGGYLDQIDRVIKNLKKYPSSRRHLVSSVDPLRDQDLALYWCHAFFQFNCRPTGDGNYYLDCQLYQRSADVFLGVPYNIASYALLTHIIAKLTGMIPGEFIHTFGDVHIYDNHMDQVEEQLYRVPRELPELLMKDEFHYLTDRMVAEGGMPLDEIIYNMEPDWFTVGNYNPHPAIKGKLSTGLR